MALRVAILVVSVLLLAVGALWLGLFVIDENTQYERAERVVVVQQAPLLQTVTVAHRDSEEIAGLKAELARLRASVDSLRIREHNVHYIPVHDSDDDEHDLTVRVRDAQGAPVEGARVMVENSDDDVEYTDEDGIAEFDYLEEDCYDVTVKADGYVTLKEGNCLYEDERMTFHLEEK